MLTRFFFMCLVAALPLMSVGCKKQCVSGEKRACYTGAESTKNIGVCREGVEICTDDEWTGECLGQTIPSGELCDDVDNNCDGSVDERVKNQCGGCAEMLPEQKPGALCQGCGIWTCSADKETISCVLPTNTPDSSCSTDEGCSGKYKCQSDGSVKCIGPKKNGCGECGGSIVAGVGESCVSDEECPGQNKCTITGTTTFCDAPRKNNCGACGEDVIGIGDACLGSAGGCEGVRQCNASGTGSTCVETTRNECDLCNGPPLPDLGKPCGGTGVCAGVYTCSTDKKRLVCNVPGSSGKCTGTNGCEGTQQCNAAGDAFECIAPEKNECNVCGAPSVVGIGDACTVNGCTGTYICSTSGYGKVCKIDASCLPKTDHVVISEFAANGTNSDVDEFIELYNPTAAEVDLSGWKIYYRTASEGGFRSSTFDTVADFPTGAKIASHHYFLVANPGSSATKKGFSYPNVTADLLFKFTSAIGSVYSNINMSHSSTGGGQIWLMKAAVTPLSLVDTNIVDFVGYGSASVKEGTRTAPTQPATKGSVERKAAVSSTTTTMKLGGTDENLGNGLDTNVNGDDFVKRDERNPQSSQSPGEP